IQTLNLHLPLLDPLHYISPLAALLEFGNEAHQVAMDAWSVAETVRVLRFADSRLERCLKQSGKIPNGALYLADLRTVWLEEDFDSPVYTEGKERKENERFNGAAPFTHHSTSFYRPLDLALHEHKLFSLSFPDQGEH
ncbi:hypothetical protein BD309DRAFT_878503, partial [Dichomitus squalens]